MRDVRNMALRGGMLCATAVAVCLGVAIAGGEPARAGEADALRRETGWPNGLVVVLDEPGLALDLGKDGRQLVMFLSTDPQAAHAVREQILAAGLAGIVTADVWDGAAIPLRGKLANVVAVGNAAAAPPAEELRRVVIPGGSIYRKRGGQWVDEKTPWPAEYDDWTNVDGLASGNAVSRDREATMPKGFQWIGGMGSHKQDGTDPLIERDTAVMDYWVAAKAYKAAGPMPGNALSPELAERLTLKPLPVNLSHPTRVGRDAFNGLPRWTHLYSSRGLTSLTLGGGNAYFPLQPVNTWGKAVTEDRVTPIRAVDLRTGEVRATFNDAPAWRTPVQKGAREDRIQVAYDRGRVYIAGPGRVTASDAKSGALLWSVDGEGATMTFPVISPDGKTLYCLDGDGVPQTIRYFGMRQVRAVVAIDTATGKLRWRSAVTSNEASQLLALDDGVLVGRLPHHGWNVGAKKKKTSGEDEPYVTGVDRFDVSGKKLWTTSRVPGKGSALGDGQIGNGGMNMLVKDGAVFVAEHWRTVRIDLASGAAESFSHPNIGCQRLFGLADSIACANLVLWSWPGGQTNPSWTYTGIAHPECGSGFSVANGRFYIRSMNMCDCNFHLRTSQCFHAEDPPEPVADAQRLTTAKGIPGPVRTVPAAPPEPHGSSLIRAEWRLGYYGELHSAWSPVVVRPDDTPQGAPPRLGEVTFTPRVHAQRLEARKGEELVWAQQLGGRPAGQPVVSDGLVIQASRDGFVYAFEAATGAPRWRFLAARADRRLVNSGQLESVWPCVGAVLHDGTLAVVAGISPETDGGGMAWGLDPATGAIRWKIEIATAPIRSEGGASTPGRESAEFAGFHGFKGTRALGRGFAMQGVKVVQGKLCVGYFRTKNFGSHGAPFWAWVALDPATDRSVDLCTRWYGEPRRPKSGPREEPQPGSSLRFFEWEDGSVTDGPNPPGTKK